MNKVREPVMSPAEQMAAMTAALAALPVGTDDGDRIDCIRQLEVLRGALAAVQARVTAAFVRSQRAEQRARGVRASRVGRGVASQVALARRISPHQAERWVGFAMIAPDELPHTFAALQAGQTSEWRATIVARETAWLSRDDRAEVDRIVAPRLADLGDRSTADEARKSAYTLDPRGYVDHLGKADADRHVSLRPAPDVMARLGALLPVAQGVAVRASLGRAADDAKAAGDTRTRGQIMADTLVERCTGLATAGDVGVEVQIMLPADGLFASSVGPAQNITAHTYGAAAERLHASRARRRRAANTRTADTETADTETADTETADTDTADTDTADTRSAAISPEAPGASNERDTVATPSPAEHPETDSADARTQSPADSADPTSETGSTELEAARSRRRRRRRQTTDRRDEPGLLLGYGPIPAAIARHLIFDRSANAPTWLRRIYECPDTGQLVAMETNRRRFTPSQCVFIRSRDQYCRTPHCGAPIRHADHVDPWSSSRRTRLDDGDGTCEACNYAKQAPGWRARSIGGGTCPDIEITTPTGHTYVSRAPTLRVFGPDERIQVDLDLDLATA